MAQNLYTVQINTIAVGFEIKINDIPLHSDWQGKPTKAEVTINHLLTGGINQIKVIIAPAKYESTYLEQTKTEFTVYQREINAPNDSRIMITQIEFPDYINDQKLKSATIPISRQFSILLNYKISWISCTKLQLNDSLINQTRDIYMNYYKALQQKNIQAILDLTSIKNTDFSKSYFYSLAQHQNKIREAYIEIFEEQEFKLVDFEKQTITPALHGFNKLITFTNKDDRSPLQFYNKEERITQSYPIYLGVLNSKLGIVL